MSIYRDLFLYLQGYTYSSSCMSNVKFKHVPVRVFLVCWVPPLVSRIHQGRLERSRGCSESRIRPYRSFSFGNKKNILFCTACHYYKYEIFLKLRQEKKLRYMNSVGFNLFPMHRHPFLTFLPVYILWDNCVLIFFVECKNFWWVDNSLHKESNWLTIWWHHCTAGWLYI